jgi:hypothetical protein
MMIFSVVVLASVAVLGYWIATIEEVASRCKDLFERGDGD